MPLRGIHKAPLERSRPLCRLDLCCVCSVQLISLALCSLIGVFSLACQLSLNSLGMSPRLLRRGVEGYFQLRGCRSDAHPAQARRQFQSRTVVIKKYSFIDCLADVSRFSSSVSARGLSFLGLTAFASRSKALAIDFDITSHRASVFLVSTWSCMIASTCPANSHASSRRPQAKDSSSSSAAVEFHSVASVPSTTIFKLTDSML